MLRLFAAVLMLAACTPTPPDPLSDCSARDAIDVEALSVSDTMLHVDYGHGGGCETHQYSICWDGSVSESEPPQARLVLWHDDGGDTCEALLSGTYSVDLQPILDLTDGPPLEVLVGEESVLVEAEGR